MIKTIFDIGDFSKIHKKYTSHAPFSSELISKYENKVPEKLMNSWKEFGLTSFSDGFLWLVFPDDYRDVISNFIYPEQVPEAHVFMRTGFGDIIFLYKNKIFKISAVTLQTIELGGYFDAVIDLNLCTRRSLNLVFFFDLYKKAFKSLGSLDSDEVYGFFPHPSIGGAIDVNTLKKVKLVPYLSMISQVTK